MPQEPPRQVLVRSGALLGQALQSSIHDTEGGYEVLVRARGRGRVVALRRSEPPVRPGRRALGLAEELTKPKKSFSASGGVSLWEFSMTQRQLRYSLLQ